VTPSADFVAYLRQVFVLMRKELRQVVRDRVLFGFTVYLFSLHIVITTLGASDDLRRATTLVYDGDRSAESREFERRLRAPYFVVEGDVRNENDGMTALDRGNARVFVDVPGDFSERLERFDQQAHVQMLVDTSKASLGYLASSYASRIAEGFGEDIAAGRLARAGITEPPPRIENRERTWFNFALDMRLAFSLQTMVLMTSVACVLLPATAAVREKERGTIEQLLVSPLSPLQIMLAKVGAMVLVTLAGTAVALYAVLEPLFHLVLRGSAPLFFAMVALYAFALSGLGLALSTLARSSAQAGLLVTLTVLPMIFLSGTATPVEGMPALMQWGVRALPLSHFLHITYGIVFRGEGLATLWPSVAAVVAIGTLFFALGLWRFRKQLA